MSNPNHETERHTMILMMALFFILSSIYMITYSGRILYNDELYMFDTTGSIVDFGDTKYDVAMWNIWDRYTVSEQQPSERYPLHESAIEPVHIVAGIPFYIVARLIPGLGLAHTTFLLNIFVSTATAVLMMQFVRLLGYGDYVALLAGLALGLFTCLWPYSRTYMREPLTMLLLLLTAFFLERARSRRSFVNMLGAAVAFVLAFYTKESALMVLPGLLLIVFPETPYWTTRQRLKRRVLGGILVSMIGAVLVLIYTDIVERLVPSPIHVIGPYGLDSQYFRDALHSYLISVGSSLWGTSPILLLAVPGAWLLIRKNQYRYVMVMAVSAFGITVGHAITTKSAWFAGATLPPRFIIPVIPLVLVCTLPVLQRLTRRPRHLLFTLLVGAVLAYSLWWQITGAFVSWLAYAGLLPPESGGLTSWRPGLNRLEYLRPVLLTPLLFDKPLDFAWVRNQVYSWPIIFGFFALISSWLMCRPQALPSKPRAILLLALPLAFALSCIAVLRAIYDDPAYEGDNDSLRQVSAIVDAEETAGDVLIVNDWNVHGTYFLNDASFDLTRVVVLPLSPGERYNFEDIPKVESDDVRDLLPRRAPNAIHALAAQRDRLWLLMETGPFIPWSIRPVERFMAQYYYPLREWQTDPPDPTVRLLEYATVPAPDAEESPEYTTPLRFGESIHLFGFSLPAGTSYLSGEVLPVTLYWQTDTPINADYTVALFLADGNDMPVTQGMDGPPGGGFLPTATWTVGEIVQDNRALRLPEETPPGEYRLWLRLYTWEDGELAYASVTGGQTIEDSMAALPITITVADN
jgi:hypothetical protein